MAYVSEMLTASIIKVISLQMEAVALLKRLSVSIRLNVTTSQKSSIRILAAVEPEISPGCVMFYSNTKQTY
jgi:hypothetical protein